MGPLAISLLLLLIEPPEPAEPAEPVAPVEDPAAPVEDPAAPVEDPAAPAAGGFGTVDSVTTDSNVHTPQPQLEQEEEDTGPRRELSARIEAGYGRTNLANAEGLDHQGLFLRAHFVFFPWISKQRRVAGGLGVLYGYQGVNRRKLPSAVGLDKSSAQQQEVLLSVDMLLRPHAQWFSIQTSALIGLGFYSNAKLFAAERPARIAKDEYAFVAGGSMALCTAHDIVCVSGGAEYLVAVETLPIDSALFERRVINPWGWHVALGFDVLRVLARANMLPA